MTSWDRSDRFDTGYYGADESRSYPKRAREADDLIELMPAAMSVEACPRCLFGRNSTEHLNTLYTWRFYYMGKWYPSKPSGMGHSRLGRHLLERQCPRCQGTWFERPADFVREDV